MDEPGRNKNAVKRLTARIERELEMITINAPDWSVVCHNLDVFFILFAFLMQGDVVLCTNRAGYVMASRQVYHARRLCCHLSNVCIGVLVTLLDISNLTRVES